MLLDIDGVFTAEAVIEAVIDGRAEIGLLGTATPPYLRGLPEVPLQAQPFIVVSPPDIPLGDNGSSVHWNDFQGQRMVVSRGESMMRDLVEQIRNSVVDVDIAVQVAHRTSILPMVLAGLGHAVLPDAWAPLATGMGATVRELLPRTSLQISIVHRDAGLTAAAAAFVKDAVEFSASPYES
ncbi:LysR substrate-binding domain-containing protein [Mycolicibacterium wolinskyi]|uniref:LysR substrate-binding domain-containing protein n=1 Tax=Mycolicibacterium wolinskyi TaxID=59750 RepID=UPI00391771A9